jgi:hypothetical protein
MNVLFGAIVKPVQNGQPLPPTPENWATVIDLQGKGKLPKDEQSTIHIGHPNGYMLIITPPEADEFAKTDIKTFLNDPKNKPQESEV